MDPLHITEFGSDRYLEKINQAQQASATATEAPVVARSQPQYTLPFRGSNLLEFDELGAKSSDQKKKGFLGLRSKFHVKGSSTPSSIEYLERRPSAAESTRQALPFDQLFQFLPNELQVEIIASLPLSDILNLRLASRSLHALVSLNEAPITRYHLDHHVPAYAKRLYPVAEGVALNFHHLCGIWHRLHVAAKLSYLMTAWITKDIFLRNTEDKRRQFAPQRERIRRRLIPLLFTVFHFFETYRDLHLKYLVKNDGKGLLRAPYTVNPIETEIMNMYDDRTLLRVHEAFPLIIASFCRRLRPPSYVGRVERSLRGYLREKPPDSVHVAILCIGGMREVERIWEVKGYNTRRTAVDNWYNSITRDVTEPEPKKKRGMLGLKRKKSTAFAFGKNTANDGATSGHGPADPSVACGGDYARSFVFNTSLSAGAPMGMLTKDQLKLILADLPVLQKIWSETAEAMILERKIVERPSDIRRNTHVLTDLIREDGLEEEDQWWYGTNAPESVRPNLDAIEEDPLE